MVADPALCPETTPVALTDAIVVSLLLQIPEPVVSARVIEAPAQRPEAPVIVPAPLPGVTEIVIVELPVPQPAATV